MDKYYTAILAVSLCTLASMVTCVVNSGNLTDVKKRQFCVLYIITGVAFACEYLGNLMQGVAPELRVAHILVKAMELSAAPFIGYMIAKILGRHRGEKAMLALLVCHAALEMLSGIFGFIYVVDANNVYSHACLYVLYVAVYLISIGYGLAAMMLTMKRYQYSGVSYPLTIAGMVMLGVLVQLLDSTLRIVWLTTMIADVMLYILYAEMIQQTDVLTGLINRRGYDVYLSHVQEKVAILFFDVDRFKNVNDTYGHAYGDFCLKKIGEELRDVYARYGKCFRIGGDEFCVIINKNTGNVETLNKLFFTHMTAIRGKENRFPYVSIGYVYFDPENNNIQDAVNEADEMMYKYKFEHRKE